MGTSSNSIATRSDCNGLISGLFSSDLYKCTTKSEINSGKKLVVLEPDVVGNKTYPKSYTNNQLVKYDDLGYYTKCEYETDDGSNFSPIIKIYNKYINPANESEPSDYIWELTPFNTSVTNSPTGSVDLGLSKDFFTSVNTSNVNITARNTASTTPLTKFKLNNYEGLASNNGNYFIWHMPNAASVIDSINSLKELIIFMTNIDNGYSISVNPSTWNTGYSANSTYVSVTSNDSWTASSNKSWLTIRTTSGTGNTSVVLEVTKNPTTSSRTGIVTFVCDHDTSKTAIVSVTQNGKSTEPEEPDTPTYRLSVTVSESNINAGSSTNATAKFYTKTNGVEDNGTTVTTSCTWESSDSNIASVGTTGRVTSKLGKYGIVTITATYTVNGQTYSDSVNVTVNYTRNYISLSSSSVTLVIGETHQLTATYYTETNGIITKSKDVTNETSWSGGSGYVSCDSNGLVTALKNSYNNEFSITASYNGYSAKCGFIVTAEPEEPTYFIGVENKDSFTWNPASDEDELSVSVTSNDSWTASSNADWLTLSKSSGTGNSSVTLYVSENTSTSKRSGTVTFKCDKDNSKTAKVEVTQDGKSTTYSISVSKTTWNSPYTGSATNVKVTSNDSWTVSSNQSWLTVSNTTGTTITSGTGNQTVILTTTENTSTSSRSATVTFVCDHDTTKTATVDVTQVGLSIADSISVSPTTWNPSQIKSSKDIDVTSNNSWEVSSDSTWITLSKTSGSGNGTVTLTVSNNLTGASRTGVVTFTCGTANATVSVTQNGPTSFDSISVSKTSITGVSPEGITNEEITITASGNWSVTDKPEWVTTYSPHSTILLVSINKNEDIISRSGTITLTCGTATATISITQRAYNTIRMAGDANATAANATAGNYTMDFSGEIKIAFSSSAPGNNTTTYTVKVNNTSIKQNVINILIPIESISSSDFNNMWIMINGRLNSIDANLANLNYYNVLFKSKGNTLNTISINKDIAPIEQLSLDNPNTVITEWFKLSSKVTYSEFLQGLAAIYVLLTNQVVS